MIDRLCRRYGLSPLDVLAMDPAEFSLCLLVMNAGMDLDDEVCRTITRNKGFVVLTRVI